MMLDDFNDILTVEDLMEILDIGKHTAYSLLNSKEIDAFKLGRTWKIPKANIRQYVMRQCRNYHFEDDRYEK